MGKGSAGQSTAEQGCLQVLSESLSTLSFERVKLPIVPVADSTCSLGVWPYSKDTKAKHGPGTKHRPVLGVSGRVSVQ